MNNAYNFSMTLTYILNMTTSNQGYPSVYILPILITFICARVNIQLQIPYPRVFCELNNNVQYNLCYYDLETDIGNGSVLSNYKA